MYFYWNYKRIIYTMIRIKHDDDDDDDAGEFKILLEFEAVIFKDFVCLFIC